MRPDRYPLRTPNTIRPAALATILLLLTAAALAGIAAIVGTAPVSWPTPTPLPAYVAPTATATAAATQTPSIITVIIPVTVVVYDRPLSTAPTVNTPRPVPTRPPLPTRTPTPPGCGAGLPMGSLCVWGGPTMTPTADALVMVPDVILLPIEEAIAMLGAAGFAVVLVCEDSDDPFADPLTIHRTSPEAGVRVPRGSPIGIYAGRGDASCGQATTPLPNATPGTGASALGEDGRIGE